MKNNNLSKLLNDKGVTAIIIALLFIVFLGIAALAVDVGYGWMVKNELQNAADAATLASARKLGSIYTSMTPAEQHAELSSANIALVKDAAISTALANKAAGSNVTIKDDGVDLIIGTWNFADHTFNANVVFPNAVRARVRRDASVAAGPITTFFARIFGRQTMDVVAEATAALSSQCTGGKSPFSISGSWFDAGCPTEKLTWEGVSANEPEGIFTNCIAWRGNKTAVTPVINCINGTSSVGCTSEVTDEIPFTNGVVNPLFDKFLALFDTMKTGHYLNGDLDNNPETWTTEVEVTEFRCGQGEGSTAKIVGYATVIVENVMIPSTKPPYKDTRAIRLSAICEVVQKGRGGGCTGPNIGDIPQLVQ